MTASELGAVTSSNRTRSSSGSTARTAFTSGPARTAFYEWTRFTRARDGWREELLGLAHREGAATGARLRRRLRLRRRQRRKKTKTPSRSEGRSRPSPLKELEAVAVELGSPLPTSSPATAYAPRSGSRSNGAAKVVPS
jgi:hypothetical protein